MPAPPAASSPPEASSPPTVDLPHTVDLAHETADPPAPAPPRRSWRRPLLVGLTVTVALATFATAATWLLRTDPADRSGTADSQTAATPLALTGAVPAPGDSPAWQLEVAAAVAYPGTTRATPGGLVIDEVHGVRAVDPRDGQPVWHWRDEPYLRTATELTDLGRTVVLALRPDGTGRDAEAGEGGERDRLVALDTATGEVRWDHVDADLVAAMTTTSVAPDGGDWFAVPERVLAPATPAGTPIPYGVQVVDGADGQTRWREEGTAGCGLISIDAGLSSSLPTQRRDVVVLTENCPNVVATGADQCQVTGFDAISGTRIWSWPPGGRLDRDPSEADLCHSSVRGGYVFVGVDQQAFALDLVSGRPQWTAEREPGSYAATGVDGMTVPELVLDGTTVAGIEYPDGPGVGSPVLVLRDLADGQRLREVELPGGTPVILRSAGADTVLATHYSIEADQVRLLQVDLATDEVTAAPVVITGAADLAIGSAGLAVGPATLAVDTLVTAEPDTEPEQVRLIVHGFG